MIESQPKDSLIYLIHIQKTSGTSLRLYFSKAFGHKSCLWHAPKRKSDIGGSDLRRIAKFHPQRFDTCRATGGHIGFADIPDVILAKSPIFVSALRDPVSRIVSHYNHIRNSPDHGLQKHIGDKTLFETIKTPRFEAYWDRIQIEYLCGHKDLSSLNDSLSKRKYIIGKQEKIDNLFLVLAQTFNIRENLETRVNVAAPGYEEEIKGQPDYQEAVRLIRKLNKDEGEFYESFDDVWINV